MPLNVPVAMQQDERREPINRHQPPICLLLLECSRLFFKRGLLTFILKIARQAKPINPQSNHKTRGEMRVAC